MKILAVDTSSAICSVALLENENIIDENTLDNGKTHSENLIPLLKELLEKNNCTLDQIDLISVTVGPGSFTGIRIGIATIKPIAEIHNIPVAEITSLETLARNDESEKNKIVLVDAKNNQAYGAVFNLEYNLIESYIADDINNIIDKFQKYGNSVVIGNAGQIYKTLITSKLKNIEFSNLNNQSAIATGRMGYKKYLEKNLKNADTVLPMYLRKSQAERMKK